MIVLSSSKSEWVGLLRALRKRDDLVDDVCRDPLGRDHLRPGLTHGRGDVPRPRVFDREHEGGRADLEFVSERLEVPRCRSAPAPAARPPVRSISSPTISSSSSSSHSAVWWITVRSQQRHGAAGEHCEHRSAEAVRHPLLRKPDDEQLYGTECVSSHRSSPGCSWRSSSSILSPTRGPAAVLVSCPSMSDAAPDGIAVGDDGSPAATGRFGA